MNKLTTSAAIPTRALKLEALSKISASFELFCLASGMEALGEMMDRDAQAICGPRHARGCDRRAHRWGKTKGKIGFHGGKVEIERLPPLRSAVGGAHEGLDGIRSLRPRFAGDPDRWHSHGRRSDPGCSDRCRREGRQASARPCRGSDRKRRDRPVADR